MYNNTKKTSKTDHWNFVSTIFYNTRMDKMLMKMISKFSYPAVEEEEPKCCFKYFVCFYKFKQVFHRRDKRTAPLTNENYNPGTVFNVALQ